MKESVPKHTFLSIKMENKAQIIKLGAVINDPNIFVSEPVYDT